MKCVINTIRLPASEKIRRAGLGLIKSGGFWFVVPSDKPGSMVGNGFKTKAEATKEALGVIRIMDRGAAGQA